METSDLQEPSSLFKMPEGWTADIGFDGAFQTGRSEVKDVSVKGGIHIDKEVRNFDLSGFYQMEKQDGTKSTDRYGGAFRYREELEWPWFVQGRVGYLVDQIKNLEHQLTPAVGIGYCFKEEGVYKGSVVPGIALTYTRENGEVTNNFSPMFNFYQDFEWKINENLTLKEVYDFFIRPDYTDDYFMNFKVELGNKLSEKLAAVFSYEFDYDNTLINKSRSDHRFGVGLKYTL